MTDKFQIHPDVQAFAQLADARYKTFDDLRIAFNKPKVVATTCLGINQYHSSLPYCQGFF